MENENQNKDNQDENNNIDIKNLKEELDRKNNQIKNLQNKLDSQDIIIEDYYKIKDSITQSKIDQTNTEKKLKSINSELISLKKNLAQSQIENEKLKKDNIILITQVQDLNKKSNYLISAQNKSKLDQKKYSTQEQIIKNIKTENEILLSKISNLSDIEEKSEKVINDLKDINFKLNAEKEILIQDKKKLEENIKFEMEKNSKLLETNKQLIEEKNKLKKENININLELKNNKKNIELIKAQNINLSEELNQNSRMLSEEKVRFNELKKINDEYKEKCGINDAYYKKEEEKNKILEKNVEDMKNKILLYNEKNIELKNNLSSYNNDIGKSMVKNEKLEKENSELKNQLKTINLELNELKKINKNLKEDLYKVKNEKKIYESDIQKLKEKNIKLIKDKEKYKSNIELFASENSEANKHIKQLNQKIIAIKKNEKNDNKILEQENYIKTLENKIAEYEQELTDYQDEMIKLNIKNKMSMENKNKYEEQLINYQQIIDKEKNKLKNADNIIARLRSELDYVKEKSVIENKVIKDEIINLKKKITELNEKLNNVDVSDYEDSENNNENNQENKNYYENNNININNKKIFNINKKVNPNNNKNKNNIETGKEEDVDFKNYKNNLIENNNINN